MKNNNVKNVIVLTHGVNTRKNKSWLLKFKKNFEIDFGNDPEWSAEHIYYGYLFFALTIIPFVKHSKVKEVQKQLREIQRKYPNAKIHVLGHSFGTMLTYEAVKRSDIDTDEESIKIGKLITVGGIIDQHERFEDTIKEGQIESIYNFCSDKDWVVKYQPLFGKCGYYGFLRNKKDKKHYLKPHDDLEVKNYRFNLKHSQYFDDEPPDFYVIWSQILRKEN